MSSPSLGKAMINAKCPRCRKGEIFEVPVYSFFKLTEVRKYCPHCDANLHPEPDFYYGAMYISYAFSVGIFITVMVGLNLLFEDPELWTYILGVVSLNVILLPLMLRYSKVLYLYGLGKLRYNPQLHKE